MLPGKKKFLDRAKKLLKEEKSKKNFTFSLSVVTIDWRYAELHCAGRLVKTGLEVFTPFNDGSIVDVIGLTKECKTLKFQIKSTSVKLGDEKVTFKIQRPNGKAYLPNQIDYFLLFDGMNTYIVPMEEVKNQKSVTLRFKSPLKNNSRIRMAKDYLL